jgi:hypothetical protein
MKKFGAKTVHGGVPYRYKIDRPNSEAHVFYAWLPPEYEVIPLPKEEWVCFKEKNKDAIKESHKAKEKRPAAS